MPPTLPPRTDRVTRAISLWLTLGLAGAGLLAPGLAAADTITITFENGFYDPNPPATGQHGPYDYLEAGARYAGFWFENAGTPTGTPVVGHTHFLWDDSAMSVVDNPHSWQGGMQGGVISLLDGASFSVVSIDYRVTRRAPWDYPDPNSQLALLPWSYALDDVQMMLATSPTAATPDFASFESQWTSFSIDDGSQRDLGGGVFDPLQTAADSPWRTLSVSGFENVSQLFIGHTGTDVAIDSIVLEVGGGVATPEPGTAVLVSVGLGILAGRRRVQRPHRRSRISA